jgi:hypothetical protein
MLWQNACKSHSSRCTNIDPTTSRLVSYKPGLCGSVSVYVTAEIAALPVPCELAVGGVGLPVSGIANSYRYVMTMMSDHRQGGGGGM